LWTYETTLKAIPYIRAVVRSLRDQWLALQVAKQQIERLDSSPGRPDRQSLVQRTLAAKKLDQAHIELEETFHELKAIDVYCLDPVQGLAMIPFGKGDELAWFVFDLFAPVEVNAWRLHTDPLATRRELGSLPAEAESSREVFELPLEQGDSQRKEH
jgi:hypothetical protein